LCIIGAWGAPGALLGTGLCGAWAVVWETAAVARATGSPPALGHAAGVAAAIACALAPSVVFPPRGLAALCAHAALFAALFLGVLRLLRPLPALDEGLVLALPPKVASAVRLFTRAPHAA
jgi:predicted membrane-bound dolichyl-phosphate-mannose-protein mannosyltransferase